MVEVGRRSTPGGCGGLWRGAEPCLGPTPASRSPPLSSLPPWRGGGGDSHGGRAARGPESMEIAVREPPPRTPDARPTTRAVPLPSDSITCTIHSTDTASTDRTLAPSPRWRALGHRHHHGALASAGDLAGRDGCWIWWGGPLWGRGRPGHPSPLPRSQRWAGPSARATHTNPPPPTLHTDTGNSAPEKSSSVIGSGFMRSVPPDKREILQPGQEVRR